MYSHTGLAGLAAPEIMYEDPAALEQSMQALARNQPAITPDQNATGISLLRMTESIGTPARPPMLGPNDKFPLIWFAVGTLAALVILKGRH